jgi:2-keto-4-pentenoate hydratase/2-oxohepta-3-ene-1,7-dioic acid hydratase in catechol pathway
MPLIRFIDDKGIVRWGSVVDDQCARPVTGDVYGEYQVAASTVPIIARLAPAEPPNILAIGRNYGEHAKEMNAEVETEPLVFLKATSCVIGPDESIILPQSAPTEVDFEAELAVVIGRAGKNISNRDAMQHVLGYTCANDISARDCQKRRDKQWARGKSFDTFCPLGPVLIPRDDIDPKNLTIRSILNGEVMQQGNTSDMIFGIAELISFLSHQFRLLSGTVILTGTPPGVGAARIPPVFLRAGDQITVEIEGIGSLCNPVIAST